MVRSKHIGYPLARLPKFRPWRACFASILICLGLFFGAPAAFAQDAALDQAKSHLTAGNPQAAYDLLKPLETERAGEPAFDYLLGISALDTDRNTEALFALERVLAVNPGNALARAEIARAYLKLGEKKTAQSELDKVRQRTDIPQAAQEAIERYLAAFRTTAAGRTEWRGYIAAVLGFDSNVNAATSDATIGIAGLAFTLAPSATESSDRFMQLRGGGSVVSPIGDGMSLIGGISGNSRWNEDLRSLDQANLSGYAGAAQELGPWSLTGALQYSQFRLDREGFRNAFGATFQARRALDRSSQISGYAQISRLSYKQQPIRNAYRSVLGLGYTRVLSGALEPVLFAGAYVASENEIKTGVEHLGHFATAANIGGRITLNEQTKVFANAAVERRDYGGTEPTFGVHRNDSRYNVGVGLDYVPAKRWTITPAVSYTRNFSNVPINDYNRTVISVMLRRDFSN